MIPVYSIELDYSQFADAIDKLLIGLRGIGTITASLGNNATVERDGREWNLFEFLDNGVSPHSIMARPGGVLANIQKEFGPVKSVQSPGQPPFNITSRVASFIDQRLQNATADLHDEPLETIGASIIKYAIMDVLSDAKKYAEDITPANWHSVKESYEVRINGRRFKA